MILFSKYVKSLLSNQNNIGTYFPQNILSIIKFVSEKGILLGIFLNYIFTSEVFSSLDFLQLLTAWSHLWLLTVMSASESLTLLTLLKSLAIFFFFTDIMSLFSLKQLFIYPDDMLHVLFCPHLYFLVVTDGSRDAFEKFIRRWFLTGLNRYS